MAECREQPTMPGQVPASEEQPLAVLRAVVERSPLAMALTGGAAHTLRGASPAFRQLLRSAPSTPGAGGMGDLLGAAVWAGVQPLLDRVFATGMAEVTADLAAVDPTRGTRAWSYAVWPVTSQDGRTEGLVLQVRETTVQGHPQPWDAETGRTLRAVNEQLLLASLREQTARDEIAAALRVRDQFLMIASHELRSPLSALLGYAYLLQGQGASGALPEAQRTRLLALLADQANRLSLLMGQLFDVTRIEQGQFVLERTPLDLRALVARVVEEFRVSLAVQSPSPTITLSADADALIVSGDAARLDEVVRNLLSNAVKYSPAGSPITVHVARAGTEAAVEVADRGIGIPQAAQAQLFDPYYRAPNVGPTSGFGIGLYVVATIVARHDGRITVESTEDQGSTFRILLPLQTSAD